MEIDVETQNFVRKLAFCSEVIDRDINRYSRELVDAKKACAVDESLMGFSEKYLSGFFGNRKLVLNHLGNVHNAAKLEDILRGLHIRKDRNEKLIDETLGDFLKKNDLHYKGLCVSAEEMLVGREFDMNVTSIRIDRALSSEYYFIMGAGLADDGFFSYRVCDEKRSNDDIVAKYNVGFFGTKSLLPGKVKVEEGLRFSPILFEDISFPRKGYATVLEGDVFGGDKSLREEYKSLEEMRKGILSEVRLEF